MCARGGKAGCEGSPATCTAHGITSEVPQGDRAHVCTPGCVQYRPAFVRFPASVEQWKKYLPLEEISPSTPPRVARRHLLDDASTMPPRRCQPHHLLSYGRDSNAVRNATASFQRARSLLPTCRSLPHHSPNITPTSCVVFIAAASSHPHHPTHLPLSSSQEIFVEAFAAAAYQTTEADRRKLVSYNDVYQAVQTGASRGQDLEFLEGIIPPQSHPAN